MKFKHYFAAALALMLCVVRVTSTFSQAASVGRVIAKELAEKLGQKSAAELVKAGGDVAVRETIEKAVQEGGELLARDVAGFAERYGAQSLRAFREAPAAMAQVMKKVPAELAESAMRAAAREPEAIARLASQVGEDAIIVAAKHPGVGVDIASKLGREGCAVAKELSTTDAIRMARFADDLAKLPAAERGGLLSRMSKAPGKVIDYIEKHPVLLKTGALTATAIVAIDRLLGNSESPGFVERLTEKFHATFVVILITLAALILARAVWWWRRVRRSQSNEFKN